ncbi:MAG: hypothetical protein A2293_12265 [Elusimicrobia bacterium RIFOXYB2_FULL_49_7]|nr:MAG: hypothetical protein A2293_12265 [Elusimicrobia bacterium RIFOXYB2_FULL_49_7]
MAETSNTGEVILAFLVGGLVGAAAGILFAPRTGKETRQRIKGLSEDLSDRIRTMGEEMKEKAGKTVSEAKDKVFSQKDRIEAAFDAGKKAYDTK